MTAAVVYRACRKAGIALAVNGDKIRYQAPADVPVPLDDIRRCKPELLAMLQGDYLLAAKALLEREADPGQWDDLAYRFDERAAVCEFDGNLNRGEAEKVAYCELAGVIEGMASGPVGKTQGRCNEKAAPAGPGRAIEAMNDPEPIQTPKTQQRPILDQQWPLTLFGG